MGKGVWRGEWDGRKGTGEGIESRNITLKINNDNGYRKKPPEGLWHGAHQELNPVLNVEKI